MYECMKNWMQLKHFHKWYISIDLNTFCWKKREDLHIWLQMQIKRKNESTNWANCDVLRTEEKYLHMCELT